MSSTLHVSPALFVIATVVAIFVIVLPFIFGSIAHKKFAVGWKYFWFGALVMLVSQPLMRVPLIEVLQNTVLAPLLHTSITFTWIWVVIQAMTAGLFEEGGRYIGYRLFMSREPKTWVKAVMYGLGHEGLESALLGGGLQILLPLLSVALLSTINLNSLPETSRQAAIQQIASVNAMPFWSPLLVAWGRLWSFPLQVALSVMVLQVFRQRQRRWFFLAVLFHTLIDFLTLALPQAFGQSTAIQLVLNGILCVFGVIGIWIIWRLREPSNQARAEEESIPF
ncbi:YhfC family intramembrane metalloprotease [Dictyobacter kobayashii]|uniref:Membrane protein n=1 Tax=Dictyobacter kobayashii TaxID=2014872 RepID=A0A402AP28_9CHLR|nr:YhfC family glutamic-type intramembrane protease [Dictyobacter kobayashii]GCE20866.1 membrane protein [Dictyobacter kobayashii]